MTAGDTPGRRALSGGGEMSLNLGASVCKAVDTEKRELSLCFGLRKDKEERQN